MCLDEYWRYGLQCLCILLDDHMNMICYRRFNEFATILRVRCRRALPPECPFSVLQCDLVERIAELVCPRFHTVGWSSA